MANTFLVLRMAWESRAHFLAHITEIEAQIHARTTALQSASVAPLPGTGSGEKAAAHKAGKSKNQPAQAAELRAQYERIFGVDLTQIPTINVLTVQALLSEIGPDLSAFPSASALASWAGLCPGTKISGGRRLGSRSRRGKPRIAVMLRQSALSLHSNKSALGARYRRLRARLSAQRSARRRAPGYRQNHLQAGEAPHRLRRVHLRGTGKGA